MGDNNTDGKEMTKLIKSLKNRYATKMADQMMADEINLDSSTRNAAFMFSEEDIEKAGCTIMANAIQNGLYIKQLVQEAAFLFYKKNKPGECKTAYCGLEHAALRRGLAIECMQVVLQEGLMSFRAQSTSKLPIGSIIYREIFIRRKLEETKRRWHSVREKNESSSSSSSSSSSQSSDDNETDEEEEGHTGKAKKRREK